MNKSNYVIPDNDYLLDLIKKLKNKALFSSEIIIIEKLKAYMGYEDSHEIMLEYFKKIFELDLEKLPLSFNRVLNFIINEYKYDYGFINGLNSDYFYNFFLNVKDLEDSFEININWKTFSVVNELLRSSDIIKPFFINMHKELNGFPLRNYSNSPSIDLLIPVSFWIEKNSKNFEMNCVDNINQSIRNILIEAFNIKDETFNLESSFKNIKGKYGQNKIDFSQNKIILNKNIISEEIEASNLSFLLRGILFLSNEDCTEWITSNIAKFEMKKDLKKMNLNKVKVKKF